MLGEQVVDQFVHCRNRDPIVVGEAPVALGHDLAECPEVASFHDLFGLSHPPRTR